VAEKLKKQKKGRVCGAHPKSLADDVASAVAASVA
jgi:hypothetical protein